MAAAGLVLGALILTRPLGIFLAPLFVAYLLYSMRADIRRAPHYVIILSACCAIVFLPWMVRNARLSGHFALSSVSTYTMLFYNVVEFEVQQGASKTEFVRSLQERLATNDGSALRSFQYQAQENALVHEYVEGHVVSYAVFHILKTIPFFIGSSIDTAERGLFTLGILQGEPPPAVNLSGLALSGNVSAIIDAVRVHPWEMLERLLWLLCTIFAFGTVVWMLFVHASTWPQVLFFAALILTLAILTGPLSQPRYRMPAEPFLLMLAFSGISWSISVVRRVPLTAGIKS